MINNKKIILILKQKNKGEWRRMTMTFNEAVAFQKAEEKVNSNPLLKEAKKNDQNNRKSDQGKGK